MSDDAGLVGGSPGATAPAATAVAHGGLVRSELLCFVSDKQRILSFDELVKVCVDFYHEDEVLAARSLLDSIVEIRMPKRKGNDRLKSTVEDIVKLMLNPIHKLPEFCAKDLARLPPVDLKHCDSSAILLEMQRLRSELRELTSIREEIASLRQVVAELEGANQEITNLKQTVSALTESQAALSQQLIEEKKTMPRQAASQIHTAHHEPSPVRPDLYDVIPSFASHATDLRISGMSEPTRLKKRLPPVIGKAINNRHLKTVITKRSVDVFITRLDPNTTASDLISTVIDILPNVPEEDIICTQLNSKFVGLYSSFYISVRVDAVLMKHTIEKLMSAESWPVGLLVRRYFKPKDGK